MPILHHAESERCAAYATAGETQRVRPVFDRVQAARRLYHARELGEPFDFLTWFEFAPEHGAAFEELVRRLRGTEEWTYVEREIDLRLAR